MATNEIDFEIRRAEATPAWFPVDLRFTIPFYPHALFVSLIIGREKRGEKRLIEERALHPLDTWGNFTISSLVGVLLGVAILYLGVVLGNL